MVKPHDEQVKVDEIAEERAKEVEDLNKVLALTSDKPSGTTADDDANKDEAKEMSKSQISSFEMAGSL